MNRTALALAGLVLVAPLASADDILDDASAGMVGPFHGPLGDDVNAVVLGIGVSTGKTRSCGEQTYDGRGTFAFYNVPLNFSADGLWTDGCGPDACNDSADGAFYLTSLGRVAFTIRELGAAPGGSCKVRCSIEGQPHYEGTGVVEPVAPGVVEFRCLASRSDPTSLSFHGQFQHSTTPLALAHAGITGVAIVHVPGNP